MPRSMRFKDLDGCLHSLIATNWYSSQIHYSRKSMETSRKVSCGPADSQQVQCCNTVASLGTLPHRAVPNISGAGSKKNIPRLSGSSTCSLGKAPLGIYAFPATYDLRHLKLWLRCLCFHRRDIRCWCSEGVRFCFQFSTRTKSIVGGSCAF